MPATTASPSSSPPPSAVAGSTHRYFRLVRAVPSMLLQAHTSAAAAGTPTASAATAPLTTDSHDGATAAAMPAADSIRELTAPLWDAAAYQAHGEYACAAAASANAATPAAGAGAGAGSAPAAASATSSAVVASGASTSGGARGSQVQLHRQLWLHGTASDSAYGILQRGLRPMSGTRGERTGAMYGKGAYLANDLPVAATFAAPASSILPLHWRRNVQRGDADGDAAVGTAAPAGSDASPAAGEVGTAAVRCELCCVLELRVIAHPDNEVYKNGDAVALAPPSAAAVAVGLGPRVPASCYLVVKDAAWMLATGLHVFEPVDAQNRARSSIAAVSTAQRGSYAAPARSVPPSLVADNAAQRGSISASLKWKQLLLGAVAAAFAVWLAVYVTAREHRPMKRWPV